MTDREHWCPVHENVPVEEHGNMDGWRCSVCKLPCVSPDVVEAIKAEGEARGLWWALGMLGRGNAYAEALRTRIKELEVDR